MSNREHILGKRLSPCRPARLATVSRPDHPSQSGSLDQIVPSVYNADMTLLIAIPEHPSQADRDAIAAPLHAYNIAHGGDPRIRSVAILLTADDGSHVGGLWGKCAYDWLFVDLLTVPEEYRGGSYGKELMAEAENIARANGCIGIYLNTFEFQALGFYEKLGFEVFGELEVHPIEQHKFFLRKRLR